MRLRGKTDDITMGEFFRARAELDRLLDQEEVYGNNGRKISGKRKEITILAISILSLLRSKSTIRFES